MPFTPEALRFFRQLAAHNEKSWFEAHRAEYEQEVREPMRELIEELDARFARFAPEIGGDPEAVDVPHQSRHPILERQIAVQDARRVLVPSSCGEWASRERSA